MKVKELLELLKSHSPEDDVLVRLDGSIFPTDNLEEHEDYNYPPMPNEVFILAIT